MFIVEFLTSTQDVVASEYFCILKIALYSLLLPLFTDALKVMCAVIATDDVI